MSPQSKTELLAEGVEEHIKKLVEKMGLRIIDLKITPEALKDNNYLGEITKVSVETEVKNERTRNNLNLIVKSATKKEPVRKYQKLEVAYNIESFYYEKIFPSFAHLQKEKGIKSSFILHPPCYYTCNKYLDEVLILEDMKEQGYSLYDRKKFLDYEHVVIGLKTYAKFHALSFALRDQKPEDFEVLKNGVKNFFYDAFPDEAMLTFLEAGNKQLMISLNEDINEEIRSKIKDLVEKCISIMKLASTETEHCVFTHGDCWINNCLFKYENTSRLPVDMCLLDFQFSFLGSPAADLSFFLFSNTSKNLLDTHHDDFLKIYYNTLLTFLIELGSDPMKLFPWDIFQKQMKKYSVHGLFYSIAAVRLMVIDTEEAPDVSSSTDLDDMVHKISLATNHNKELYKRLRDIVLVCEKFGYI